MAGTDLARGQYLGEQVARTFNNQEGFGVVPDRVIIDEVRGQNPPTVGTVYWAAVHLRNNYPQFAGRWGSTVQHWTSTGWNLVAAQPAIDALLDANAFIVLEQYINQAGYCAKQSQEGTGAADVWMALHFNGEVNQNQWTEWLYQHRGNRGSSSAIHHLFGVTDDTLGGASPFRFQDRMFYVLRTRATRPELMHVNYGGVGSWVWDNRVINAYPGRDLEFRNSWFHYCWNYSTSATYTVQC